MVVFCKNSATPILLQLGEKEDFSDQSRISEDYALLQSAHLLLNSTRKSNNE